MRLVVEETFSAAHRLLGYDGPCGKLHGHNWRVRVEIEGRPDNIQYMVVDFTEIKRIIRELDHKVLLCEDDKMCLILAVNGHDVVKLPHNPTCECLAEYIARRIIEIYGQRLSYISVTVWETDKQSATYATPVSGP